MWSYLHKLASPKYFYHWTGRLLPWLGLFTLLFFAYGLVGGLFLAPADYQQGDAFRIIYIHVPAALLSLAIFTFLTICAVSYLIWRVKLADILLQVAAPLGAWMTFLALCTGALWGKPMWGTWWIWDARLTSELILLFLYLGVIALRQALPSQQEVGRAVAIFVIIGFVDIPIIHYSVYWWNTLHQGATITKFATPSMPPQMLYPLLAMIVAFVGYFLVVLLLRARCQLLLREKKTKWVRQLVNQ